MLHQSPVSRIDAVSHQILSIIVITIVPRCLVGCHPSIECPKVVHQGLIKALLILLGQFPKSELSDVGSACIISLQLLPNGVGIVVC